VSITFAINESHDFTISPTGKLKIVMGAEEVKQRILVTLLHNYQEYFLNVPAGVPWQEYILGSKNKQNVENLIRSEILSVPGVLSVIDVRSIFADRVLDIYADVEVSTGEVVTVSVTGR
jgi:hypothetical protein